MEGLVKKKVEVVEESPICSRAVSRLSLKSSWKEEVEVVEEFRVWSQVKNFCLSTSIDVFPEQGLAGSRNNTCAVLSLVNKTCVVNVFNREAWQYNRSVFVMMNGSPKSVRGDRRTLIARIVLKRINSVANAFLLFHAVPQVFALSAEVQATTMASALKSLSPIQKLLERVSSADLYPNQAISARRSNHKVRRPYLEMRAQGFTNHMR